jgi:hypothetical protein
MLPFLHLPQPWSGVPKQPLGTKPSPISYRQSRTRAPMYPRRHSFPPRISVN